MASNAKRFSQDLHLLLGSSVVIMSWFCEVLKQVLFLVQLYYLSLAKELVQTPPVHYCQKLNIRNKVTCGLLDPKTDIVFVS